MPWHRISIIVWTIFMCFTFTTCNTGISSYRPLDYDRYGTSYTVIRDTAIYSIEVPTRHKESYFTSRCGKPIAQVGIFKDRAYQTGRLSLPLSFIHNKIKSLGIFMQKTLRIIAVFTKKVSFHGHNVSNSELVIEFASNTQEYFHSVTRQNVQTVKAVIPISLLLIL